MFEHECIDCNYFTINHKSSTPGYCPNCGGKIQHSYDDDSVRED